MTAAVPPLQHPTALRNATGTAPLEVADDLWAWRTGDGDVILQDEIADITVPAAVLARLAQGLLAVHVHNGRSGAKATRS